MAKKSFNQRVPAFKWIFLLAIVLSILITTFSVKQQTQTNSHAMIPPESGGPWLPAVKFYYAKATCTRIAGTNTANLTATVKWYPVVGASQYLVYRNISTIINDRGSKYWSSIVTTLSTSNTVKKVVPTSMKYFNYTANAENPNTKSYGDLSNQASGHIALSCY